MLIVGLPEFAGCTDVVFIYCESVNIPKVPLITNGSVVYEYRMVLYCVKSSLFH